VAFPPRKVLLAAREEHLAPRLFSSASSLAKRMSAGLEILMQADRESPPEIDAGQARHLQEEGIAYRLTCRAALSAQDVVRYANTHECVVCVVIDAPENWGGASAVWEKLACPLVVTAQNPSAPIAGNG